MIEDSRRRFERVPGNTVVEVHGNHYLFLQHSAEVERIMRSFLLNTTAAGAT